MYAVGEGRDRLGVVGFHLLERGAGGGVLVDERYLVLRGDILERGVVFLLRLDVELEVLAIAAIDRVVPLLDNSDLTLARNPCTLEMLRA